ncbi:MAG: winged helix-turn-helix transcriptional regulator [Promethearchaeota archaeon]
MKIKIRPWNRQSQRRYELYEIIDVHPGINIYELVGRVKWNIGQVRRAVKRLKKEGLVKS